jgi:hypothetical protein
MTLLSLSMLLLMDAGGPLATYRVISAGGAATYQERIDTEDGGRIVRISRSNDDGVLELPRSPALELKSWRQRSETLATDLTATRDGNVIVVQGTVKGKDFSREVKLDGHPWYQAVDLAVVEFVRSGKASQEFWLLTGEEMTPRLFVFKRGAGEKVRSGDREAEAVKVRFTLPGFKGSFWGSDYWVRESDGRLVKFEGTRGPPGAPRLTIELVEEG